MKYLLMLLAIMGLGVIPIDCGKNISANRPTDIRYGVDACDECRMIINESRFATAYRGQDGQPRRFDDIGCMVLYLHQHDEHVKAYWVHDYQANKWMRGKSAYFVHSDSLYTPMGYGIVAMADEENAQLLANAHQGNVVHLHGVLALRLNNHKD
jgi:copper chaperone NosL